MFVLIILGILAPALAQSQCKQVYADRAVYDADCKPIGHRSIHCTSEQPDCEIYETVPPRGPQCNRPTKTVCAAPGRFR